MFLQNVKDVIPSKPCKFGAGIFLCYCVITIQVFILGCILEKSQKVTALGFVTGLMWIKIAILLLLVKFIMLSAYFTHVSIHETLSDN